MIKGVLFDLDGTLLDTLEDLYQSVNAALAACGFPGTNQNGSQKFCRKWSPESHGSFRIGRRRESEV